MALSATDLIFTYPEHTSLIQEDKVGGYPTGVELTEPNVDGETQLFNLAVLYTGTYKQYQKVFIKNNGDEIAQNVELYGYNNNSNNIVTVALERGQDQQITYDGQEQIKDNSTEPTLYTEYTFQEILSGSPLSIPDIGIGESVGVWLKMEFSTIDAFNEKDEFVLGVNFEGVAGTPLNAEKILGHSRIDGNVNIIQVKRSKNIFRGVVVEYEWVNTDNLGIPDNEAVYGVYVDRILVKEHTGSNRTPLQLYENDVPVLIEIFLLPYGGYRPTLDSLPAVRKNRIKLTWQGKNPEIADIVKYYVYWDNATGTFLIVPILQMDADNGLGGGNNVDISGITN